jgi:pimeloyl-ACP methyl ester carboxylesterase
VTTVAGVDVHIDGGGESTVLMLHGWPDDHRLWDTAVVALQDRWRCVRFTLPGFDRSQPVQGHTLDEVTSVIRTVVDQVSPDQPVTLLLHDWGCVYGYHFAQRYPERVKQIVGVDVGDVGSRAHVASLSLAGKLATLAYQLWLAAAWRIGGAMGDRMTRFMARQLRAPAAPEHIGVHMNYPYDIAWTGSYGSFKALRPFNPTCPMLYVYGTRKPVMFHSPAWVAALKQRPGCAVEAFETGHWVMAAQPEGFNQVVRDWLGC